MAAFFIIHLVGDVHIDRNKNLMVKKRRNKKILHHVSQPIWKAIIATAETNKLTSSTVTR